MKNIREDFEMQEIDVISDTLSSLEVVKEEEYESVADMLNEVSDILSNIGLSFDKDEMEKELAENDSVEVELKSEDGNDASLEVFQDESIDEKIDGDLALKIEKLTENKFDVNVLVYFDDEEAKKLSDVEFEPVDDEKEVEQIEEDDHATEDYIDYGWITDSQAIFGKNLPGVIYHSKFKLPSPGKKYDHNSQTVKPLMFSGGYERAFDWNYIRWFVDKGGLFQLENTSMNSIADVSGKQMKLIKYIFEKFEMMINDIAVDFGTTYREFPNFSDLKRYWRHLKENGNMRTASTMGEEVEEKDEEMIEPENMNIDSMESEEENDINEKLKKIVIQMLKTHELEDKFSEEELDTFVSELKTDIESDILENDDEEYEDDNDETSSNEFQAEPLSDQDSSDITVYETVSQADMYNVILFKPNTRLIISRILTAKSENQLETIVKKEYPDFIIHSIYPIMTNTI